MAVLDYPGLDRVEDEGTKDALRLMWDEIRTLDEREEVSDGVSTSELDTIKAALQQGGSHQIDVGGLGGLLQGTQKGPTRRFGSWMKTTGTAGAGYYDFDRELIVQPAGAFRMMINNTAMRFTFAGTYLVIAQIGSRGHASGVHIRMWYQDSGGGSYRASIDDDTVAAVAWSGVLVDIMKVQAGDYIRFHNFYASTRRGATSSRITALYVIGLD